MAVYIDFAKHVISTVMTLLFLPLSFIIPPTESYEAKRPDELNTGFTVLSDVHIEGNNFPTFENYANILKQVYNSKNNDTLVFLGDNTMNCQHIESIFFYTALRLTKPADNLVIAPGNHDYGNGTGDYEKYADRFLGYANFAGCDIDTTYYYKIIDGYYYIVLTTESDTVNGSELSDEQLDWLTDVLNEASEEDKPIFIFHHHPINYIENGSSDRLINVIDDYENIIYFYGHTHWALSPHTVTDVNGVTCINVPKSTEIAENEADASCVGAVVEVYDEEVLVRFRDFNSGVWVDGHEYSFEF